MEMTADIMLPLICTGLIGLGICIYVLLDGFSLGTGILYIGSLKDEVHRDYMMASVTPVWDGNQTWIVLGGALLFAAFPQAFRMLLENLYLPIAFMLIALVFRGVAFEFRFKAVNKRWWNRSFSGGAILAAFCQGFILGEYVQSPIADSGIEWMRTGFSVFCGVAVILAYALIGACWLNIKTEGELQAWARKRALLLLPIVLFCIGVISIWTPVNSVEIANRWFKLPNLIVLSAIPIHTFVSAIGMFYMLKRGKEWEPFVLCCSLYLIVLSGLTVSIWPYIVPWELNLWEAAAPVESLQFLLTGVALILPIILMYTAHAYYVFRGKVSLEEVYHD